MSIRIWLLKYIVPFFSFIHVKLEIMITYAYLIEIMRRKQVQNGEAILVTHARPATCIN